MNSQAVCKAEEGDDAAASQTGDNTAPAQKGRNRLLPFS